MNARFSRVVSRLSLVSALAVSAVGLAACTRAQPSDPKPAAAESAAARGPGNHLFREVEALDLRVDQRAVLVEIEQDLRDSLSPHRETVRQVAETLAAGVEQGSLDAEALAAQKEVLAAALADAKESFDSALNDVHDALDASQRADLVERLRARHEQHRSHEEDATAKRDGAIVKITLQLGLTDAQKQEIRSAVREGLDELFPDRKARREAWEAKMKALGDAFVSDDFDAADFDLGAGAREGVESFGEIASLAVDVSGRVLSAPQRQMVAVMIRAKAEKI